jgi:DNA-binding beta-propeller fold protein YncE
MYAGFALLLAAAPLPQDKRIVATVARTIAPPPATRPMHMPTDVAVDSAGRVYVADGANDRVLRFVEDGRLDETFKIAASLKRPAGLFVDSSDVLWIADTGNRRLVTVNAKGEATPFELPQVKEAAADPTDVVLSADLKRLYVVDNDNHRVLIRENPTGKWSSMGSAGRALGQFQWPFFAGIDREGYVYLSEAIGGRVQSISPADKWAGDLGRWGIEAGQLYRPKGVACHPVTGHVFISDSTLAVVQVFTPRGGFAGVLCDPDGTPLRFQHPMGLAFDPRGNLNVVELKANRVAVVSLPAVKK